MDPNCSNNPNPLGSGRFQLQQYQPNNPQAQPLKLMATNTPSNTHCQQATQQATTSGLNYNAKHLSTVLKSSPSPQNLNPQNQVALKNKLANNGGAVTPNNQCQQEHQQSSAVNQHLQNKALFNQKLKEQQSKSQSQYYQDEQLHLQNQMQQMMDPTRHHLHDTHQQCQQHSAQQQQLNHFNKSVLAGAQGETHNPNVQEIAGLSQAQQPMQDTTQNVQNSHNAKEQQQPQSIVNSNSTSIIVKQPKRIGPYQLGDNLGRGAFGKVYKGYNTENGQLIAIKQVTLHYLKDHQKKSIMTEIELLKRLDHPNIVKYKDSIQTDNHLNIILEYVENGSLETIVQKFGTLQEPLVAMYVQQVLFGLDYLHSQNVIHRDIKGGNILTTKDGIVKLADFGVAVLLNSDHTTEKSNSLAGTSYWMAPEVIEENGKVTTACDIWSLGCTIIELLTGKPPRSELKPISAIFKIAQEPMPPIPVNISIELMDFLKQCFQKDPSKRIDAKGLLQHKWLSKFDSNVLKKILQISKKLPQEVTNTIRMHLDQKINSNSPKQPNRISTQQSQVIDDEDNGELGDFEEEDNLNDVPSERPKLVQSINNSMSNINYQQQQQNNSVQNKQGKHIQLRLTTNPATNASNLSQHNNMLGAAKVIGGDIGNLSQYINTEEQTNQSAVQGGQATLQSSTNNCVSAQVPHFSQHSQQQTSQVQHMQMAQMLNNVAQDLLKNKQHQQKLQLQLKTNQENEQGSSGSKNKLQKGMTNTNMSKLILQHNSNTNQAQQLRSRVQNNLGGQGQNQSQTQQNHMLIQQHSSSLNVIQQQQNTTLQNQSQQYNSQGGGSTSATRSLQQQVQQQQQPQQQQVIRQQSPVQVINFFQKSKSSEVMFPLNNNGSASSNTAVPTQQNVIIQHQQLQSSSQKNLDSQHMIAVQQQTHQQSNTNYNSRQVVTNGLLLNNITHSQNAQIQQYHPSTPQEQHSYLHQQNLQHYQQPTQQQQHIININQQALLNQQQQNHMNSPNNQMAVHQNSIDQNMVVSTNNQESNELDNGIQFFNQHSKQRQSQNSSSTGNVMNIKYIKQHQIKQQQSNLGAKQSHSRFTSSINKIQQQDQTQMNVQQNSSTTITNQPSMILNKQKSEKKNKLLLQKQQSASHHSGIHIMTGGSANQSMSESQNNPQGSGNPMLHQQMHHVYHKSAINTHKNSSQGLTQANTRDQKLITSSHSSQFQNNHLGPNRPNTSHLAHGHQQHTAIMNSGMLVSVQAGNAKGSSKQAKVFSSKHSSKNKVQVKGQNLNSISTSMIQQPPNALSSIGSSTQFNQQHMAAGYEGHHGGSLSQHGSQPHVDFVHVSGGHEHNSSYTLQVECNARVKELNMLVQQKDVVSLFAEGSSEESQAQLDGLRSQIVEKVTMITKILSNCQQGGQQSVYEQVELFKEQVARDIGYIALVEMLKDATMSYATLQLINQLCEDCPKNQEIICVSGFVPHLIRLGSIEQPRTLQIEVAYFIGQSFPVSRDVLQMIISNDGCQILIGFLSLSYEQNKDLIVIAIDSLFLIYEESTNLQIGEDQLSQMFSNLGLQAQLVKIIPKLIENVETSTILNEQSFAEKYLERTFDMLYIIAQGPLKVKLQFCQSEVLKDALSLAVQATLNDPSPYTYSIVKRYLKIIQFLSSNSMTFQYLEKQNILKILVDILQFFQAEIDNNKLIQIYDILKLLSSLCKQSPSRTKQATIDTCLVANLKDLLIHLDQNSNEMSRSKKVKLQKLVLQILTEQIQQTECRAVIQAAQMEQVTLQIIKNQQTSNATSSNAGSQGAISNSQLYYHQSTGGATKDHEINSLILTFFQKWLEQEVQESSDLTQSSQFQNHVENFLSLQSTLNVLFTIVKISPRNEVQLYVFQSLTCLLQNSAKICQSLAQFYFGLDHMLSLVQQLNLSISLNSPQAELHSQQKQGGNSQMSQNTSPVHLQDGLSLHQHVNDSQLSQQESQAKESQLSSILKHIVRGLKHVIVIASGQNSVGSSDTLQQPSILEQLNALQVLGQVHKVVHNKKQQLQSMQLNEHLVEVYEDINIILEHSDQKKIVVQQPNKLTDQNQHQQIQQRNSIGSLQQDIVPQQVLQLGTNQNVNMMQQHNSIKSPTDPNFMQK